MAAFAGDCFNPMIGNDAAKSSMEAISTSLRLPSFTLRRLPALRSSYVNDLETPRSLPASTTLQNKALSDICNSPENLLFLCGQHNSRMLSCVSQARFTKPERNDPMPRQYTPRSANQDVKGRFVTVAFDEKTRFLLEIAARSLHRTVSNFINEAVLNYIPTLIVTECNERIPLKQIVDEIWSPI